MNDGTGLPASRTHKGTFVVAETIRLGISACLLGRAVRYDGGHRLDPFLADTLGRLVEYIPVCPEVECGLPVPREPMRLEGDPEHPRLITIRTRRDLTARMERWARRRVRELARENLCGFIFKCRSPSCGIASVKVYAAGRRPRRRGAGIFARLFIERFAAAPVEEDERLRDPARRENFIERLFTLKRWRECVARGPARAAPAAFHARHDLLLRAHSPARTREMARLLAGAGDFSPADLRARYFDALAATLRLRATARKHADVLQRVARSLGRCLSADERRDLAETIAAYRREEAPLVVPVTLLAHHARVCRRADLLEQVYLFPHPLELRLRNHA